MSKDISNEVIKYFNKFFKNNNLDSNELIKKIDNLKVESSKPLTNITFIKHEGKSGAILAVKKNNPNIIVKMRIVDFYIRKSV